MTNFPGSLIDIEYHLPEKVVGNDFFQEAYPEWRVDQTEKKTGVYSRRIAGESETAYDLSLVAVKKLLEKHPGLSEEIDAIIYCTQSPDHIMPSNAFLLQRDLKFSKAKMVFDYNLACSGYVYGLAMASSFIRSGLARNILLVTADTYSKYLNPSDRATQMLFGDGASASWIGESSSGKKPIISTFEDFDFDTDAGGWDKFIIKSGGLRQPVARKEDPDYNDKIQMNGIQVVNFVNHLVIKQIRDMVSKHKLEPNEVDQYLVHQASLMAVDGIKSRMKLEEGRMFTNLEKIGNTVSSSLPILIKDYHSKSAPKPGARLIICGFGVGFSWGSLLARA